MLKRGFYKFTISIFIFLLSGANAHATECSAEILDRLKNKYVVLHGAPVMNCKKETFHSGKNPVHFLGINYGTKKRCTPGCCLYSSACFIIDTDGIYPYAFKTHGETIYARRDYYDPDSDLYISGNAEILAYFEPDKKSNAAQNFCLSSKNCPSQLLGRSHTITQDDNFKKFIESLKIQEENSFSKYHVENKDFDFSHCLQ